MNRIVECIANFSEGRRAEVVDSIAEAIRSANGAVILDKRWIPIITAVSLLSLPTRKSSSTPPSAQPPKAAELIDLNVHKGEHPRLGANRCSSVCSDSGRDDEECVKLARDCGQRIATELNIPVYLTKRPLPDLIVENLANIRKGEFEGVRAEISTNPNRKPDFGEPVIHPTAGATVVGARMPDRLQHQSEHKQYRYRNEDCQGGTSF